ncbi:MAG: T9SS type A sorting domain-containing protein [Bacteroidota bacterium]
MAPSCTNLGEITVDVQAGFGSKEMFTISLTNDITFANETVNLLGSSVSYTFTNLDPGIYSIIVEDETFKNPNTIFTGCNTFYTVTLLSSALEFDASVSAGGCPGDSVGSIDLTVSSSIGPVSFDWSTGDTTEDISHLVPGMYTVTVSDSSGCIVQDSFVVDTAANCPTNNDISLRSLIHIFPNPTTNILQVESENLTIQQIQLFDLRGRMLMEKREQTDILDLHGLSQGIYILEVQTDQGILTEKIIKQ